MKTLIRAVMLLSFSAALISIILLLNFTAPNPTGRRYSSQVLSSSDNGRSAEWLLSRDLRLPHNDQVDGMVKCICGQGKTQPPGRCTECLINTSCAADHFIPDFVGTNFIADSKSYRASRLSLDRQTTAFICAAKETRQPLWIYVNTNSSVAADFAKQVESTGGGVVYYFADAEYTDPVDVAAGRVLVVSIAIVVLAGLAEKLHTRPRRVVVVSAPLPRAPRPPADPVSKAVRKTSTAESFLQASKDRAHREIDREDWRED